MSLTGFIRRYCNKTAVYWGTPTEDGYGNYTYADPVEISVRWENHSEVIMTSKGLEKTSKAKVLLTQDVDEEGMLYLGTLDDLDSDQESDPSTIDGAYSIIKFDKVPDIKGNVYVRKVWL